jgi:hypothetical protein
MMWSEIVGLSIVVPSDRTEGDGRNYIVMGEDVPTEIADKFTAALVFRSGQTLAAGGNLTGFVYWAFGISTDGNLEIVVYYYADVSAGNGQFVYYRQTIISCRPPSSGVDNPPMLVLGADASSAYNEKGVSVDGSNLYIAEREIFTRRRSDTPEAIGNVAWTGLVLDVVVYERNPYKNISPMSRGVPNSRMYAPVAGYYEISGGTYFDGNATGRRGIRVGYRDTAPFTSAAQIPLDGTGMMIGPGQNQPVFVHMPPWEIWLPADGWAELQVFHEAGVTLNTMVFTDARAWGQLRLIRAGGR